MCRILPILWRSDLHGHFSHLRQRFQDKPEDRQAGRIGAVLPRSCHLSAGRPDFHAEGSDPRTPPGAVSMFYVVTYAGSGLVTVGVGLLATLLGLTVAVRWFAAVLAAACLLMLAVLRARPRPGRAPDPLDTSSVHM